MLSKQADNHPNSRLRFSRNYLTNNMPNFCKLLTDTQVCSIRKRNQKIRNVDETEFARFSS